MEHLVIPDAQRHEAKGASTASVGQVLKANGDGTTSWVAPSTLINTVTTTVLQQGSTVAQNPSALDTALQVNFGSATANTNIDLSAGGTITLLTAGSYEFLFDLSVGRTTAVGDAYLFWRILLNSSPTGFVKGMRLPSQDVILPQQFRYAGVFSAGNTVKLEFVRDSLGINNGGLIAANPVVSGWSDLTTAGVTVKKIVGAS